MFEAAVGKFAKSVGKESLVPVPSLDEASKCRPLHVVAKKNRRWFWQSAKYTPSAYELHQILTKPDDITAQVTSRDLVQYNKQHTFSADGKVGTKLKEVIDVELSGNDKYSITANFGQVVKLEVDLPALVSELNERVVDLRHPYIEQLRQDKRKVLCVVTGDAEVAQDCQIVTTSTAGGKENMDFPNLDLAHINLDENASVTDTSKNTFKVMKNTPLAYNVRELLISPTGQIRVMLMAEEAGGFEGGDEVDGALVDDLSLDNHYEGFSQLQPEDRDLYAKHMLSICGTPQAVDQLLLMVKDAERTITSDRSKTVTLAEVQGKFKSTSQEYWKWILERAGFKFQDDGSVVYPKENVPFLTSLWYLLEALEELDDDELVQLKDCNSNVSEQLKYVLHGTINGEVIKTDDPKAQPLYKEPNSGQEFLQTLGFQIGDGNVVMTAHDNISELQGAYRAIYGLWLPVESSDKTSTGYRCDIL